LLDRYLEELSFTVPKDKPLTRNRSGHVYSKDTLGDDYRAVRELVFPGDKRRLLRRTGNVEAMVGSADRRTPPRSWPTRWRSPTKFSTPTRPCSSPPCARPTRRELPADDD